MFWILRENNFLAHFEFLLQSFSFGPLSYSCLTLCSSAFLAHDDAGGADDGGTEAMEVGAMMGGTGTRDASRIAMGGASEAEMTETHWWGWHEGRDRHGS